MDSVSRPVLQVDPDLCMGSGQCIWYAPSTFDQDENATAFVIDAHGDPEDKIQEAIESCPARAISRVEAEP
jgi:ferredoxin